MTTLTQLNEMLPIAAERAKRARAVFVDVISHLERLHPEIAATPTGNPLGEIFNAPGDVFIAEGTYAGLIGALIDETEAAEAEHRSLNHQVVMLTGGYSDGEI